MRKNTTFMFAAAVAALLLAGCDKGASYSSFELSTADFRGADGAKTQWTANGLYWEDGDAVVINRTEHTIHGSDSSWYTTGTKTNSIDDYFYVAYPSGSMSDDGTTVSGVDFSGGVVPLACKGKTNKLTLYPCCAVIKVSKWVSNIGFKKENGDASEDGTLDAKVLTKGSINVENNTVFADAEAVEIDYTSMSPAVEDIDGYNYFVIPMDGGVMHAVIDFEYSRKQTNGPVELRAGYLYTVNIEQPDI